VSTGQVCDIWLTAPDGTERQIQLVAGSTLAIGRSESSDCRIDSPKASRNHATIRVSAEGVFVQDLGSLNGTFLNGKLITGVAPLRTGDRVLIAGYEFAVRVRHELQPMSRSDETRPVELQVLSGSILVSDIVGYTSLSEALPAKELTAVLRIWSERVSQVITLLDGVVDKFIGDCVMAHWLTKDTKDLADIAEKAQAAARRIYAETVSLESSVMWPFAPKYRWQVKSSIATGEVVFGNMGRGKARSFSVFGDTVNRVFRMNDLCNDLGKSLVVDEQTANLVADKTKFSLLRETALEGKTEKVKVFG
jgi:class 3 adenylate cyclase